MASSHMVALPVIPLLLHTYDVSLPLEQDGHCLAHAYFTVPCNLGMLTRGMGVGHWPSLVTVEVKVTGNGGTIYNDRDSQV